MSRQQDAQRARRDRAEGRSGPGRARRERERAAERLVAQVLDLVDQREVLVRQLDIRAGRLLTEIKALRCPPAREVAAATGLTLREITRLRDLVQPSVLAPTLDDSTTTTDARRRQRFDEE